MRILLLTSEMPKIKKTLDRREFMCYICEAKFTPYGKEKG